MLFNQIQREHTLIFLTDITLSTIYNTSRSALSYIKHKSAADKARTTSALNGLKSDTSEEFIGEEILEINVV